MPMSSPQRKHTMKITVNHMTSSETSKKVAAAKKNGYYKYEDLPSDKRLVIDKDIAMMMAVCTPSIINYVMDCQMGKVSGCFHEIPEFDRPVLMPSSRWLELFNVAMTAKSIVK